MFIIQMRALEFSMTTVTDKMFAINKHKINNQLSNKRLPCVQ